MEERIRAQVAAAGVFPRGGDLGLLTVAAARQSVQRHTAALQLIDALLSSSSSSTATGATGATGAAAGGGGAAMSVAELQELRAAALGEMALFRRFVQEKMAEDEEEEEEERRRRDGVVGDGGPVDVGGGGGAGGGGSGTARRFDGFENSLPQRQQSIDDIDDDSGSDTDSSSTGGAPTAAAAGGTAGGAVAPTKGVGSGLTGVAAALATAGSYLFGGESLGGVPAAAAGPPPAQVPPPHGSVGGSAASRDSSASSVGSAAAGGTGSPALTRSAETASTSGDDAGWGGISSPLTGSGGRAGVLATSPPASGVFGSPPRGLAGARPVGGAAVLGPAMRTSTGANNAGGRQQQQQQQPKPAAAGAAPATSATPPTQSAISNLFNFFTRHSSPAVEAEAVSVADSAAQSEAFGPPQIPFSELEFAEEDLIGSGSFGSVYAGSCRRAKVAIKVPNKQDLTADERETFEREVDAMRRVFHPNIVLFLGGCMDPGPGEKIALVMQLVATDLERILTKDRKARLSYYEKMAVGVKGASLQSLTLRQRLGFARDAATGLAWLHGVPVVHRDMKPANLLVDESGRVLITDFGFAVFRSENDVPPPEEADKIIGTPLYMPPERLLGSSTDDHPAAGDCYALGGLILWEIMTSHRLFEEFSNFNTFTRTVCSGGVRPPTHRDGQTSTSLARSSPRSLPAWAGDVPPCVAALMHDCWEASARRRPTSAQIVDRLDYCTVEVAIQDAEARAFWRSLSDKHSASSSARRRSEVLAVSFDALVPALVRATGVETARVDKLRAEFVVEDSGAGIRLVDTGLSSPVTVDSFDQAVLTFGRFFSDAAVLERMCSICEANCWHGYADRNEASKLVVGAPAGTFLLRRRRIERPLSLSSMCWAGEKTGDMIPFALTNSSDRANLAQGQHRLVRFDALDPDGKFEIKVRGKWASFPSLADMVAAPEVGLSMPVRVHAQTRRKLSAYDSDSEED